MIKKSKLSKLLSAVLALGMMVSTLPMAVMAEVTEPKTVSVDIVGDFNESSSTGFALKKATTWRNRKSETTTSGASRAAYYIFKNISAEDAAGLKTGATFSVSKKFKTGHSTTGHNKVYFAVGTSAISDTPTVEEINAYANNGKTANTTYTVENTNAQYKAEVAIPQSIIEQIEEGVTIVVGMPKCCNNGYHYGGAGTYPPVLTYDYAALKTAAFTAVNEAADKTAMAAALATYRETIGIDTIIANITDDQEFQEAVAEKILANIAANGSYSDFATIAADYQTAYDEAYPVIALKRVNEAADAAALATVFEQYKEILGISDVYAAAAEHELLTVVAEAMYNGKGEGYESLTAVVEAYSNAYQTALEAAYTSNIKYADAVMNNEKDTTTYTLQTGKIATTNLYQNNVFYVFNDISDIGEAKALTLSFYSDFDGSYKSKTPTYTYYIGNGTAPTESEAFAEYLAACTTATMKYTISECVNGSLVVCDTPDFEIANGQTLIVKIPYAASTNIATLNRDNDAQKPQLTYNIAITAEEPVFTLTGKTVTETITANEAVTATATFTNTTENPENVCVIVALYEQSGRMISVDFTETTVAAQAGEGVEVSAELTAPQTLPTGAYAKAFVWNSISGMEPIELTE